MSGTQSLFSSRHGQYETRHCDVYGGVDWSAWGLGVEAHYDDADTGSIWATLRLGPVYLGARISR